MLAYNIKMAREFSWSTDPEDQKVIEFKVPDKPPPHCGVSESKPRQLKASRRCCNCGVAWECTENELVYGTCPSCGAYGADGKGGSYKTGVPKIDKDTAGYLLPVISNILSMRKHEAGQNMGSDYYPQISSNFLNNPPTLTNPNNNTADNKSHCTIYDLKKQKP